MGVESGTPEKAHPPLAVALKWTSKAHADLVRLHEFLRPVKSDRSKPCRSPTGRGHQAYTYAPSPRRTTEQFDPREVRKVLIGDYEVRYAVLDADVFVLRIFHTREDR